MTPSYYAVIFTSKQNPNTEGYDDTGTRMAQLCSEQPGFLGISGARNDDGSGITVCYWDSIEAIKNWKTNNEHLYAQKMGRKMWYESYSVRIAKVEEEYSMEKL